jgi:hypothetical protein
MQIFLQRWMVAALQGGGGVKGLVRVKNKKRGYTLSIVFYKPSLVRKGGGGGNDLTLLCLYRWFKGFLGDL